MRQERHQVYFRKDISLVDKPRAQFYLESLPQCEELPKHFEN
uniref:Uncharacterized protein n=1 Tax=Rhizophora mucronata TaxID=61149 RepID=A0A2P2N1R3_RHIMU